MEGLGLKMPEIQLVNFDIMALDHRDGYSWTHVYTTAPVGDNFNKKWAELALSSGARMLLGFFRFHFDTSLYAELKELKVTKDMQSQLEVSGEGHTVCTGTYMS